MGLAPTASTTAALAMGDALAVALFQQRGFKEEDFTNLHPGGTLGRRLLKVRDLMHQGDAIPRIRNHMSVRDAILEMTTKKLGMTTVVDASGHLVGVITDGDLRRFLERGVDLAASHAGDLASGSPRVIGPDELAARAVQTMEQHAITSLVVLEDEQIIGVIHLHDLLRSGVV
jgi:arabinose-5-phosphate isomerase